MSALNVSLFLLLFLVFYTFVANGKKFKSEKGCVGCGKKWQNDVDFKTTGIFSEEELNECFGRRVTDGDLCCGCCREVRRWRESGKKSKVSYLTFGTSNSEYICFKISPKCL